MVLLDYWLICVVKEVDMANDVIDNIVEDGEQLGGARKYNGKYLFPKKFRALPAHFRCKSSRTFSSPFISHFQINQLNSKPAARTWNLQRYLVIFTIRLPATL